MSGFYLLGAATVTHWFDDAPRSGPRPRPRGLQPGLHHRRPARRVAHRRVGLAAPPMPCSAAAAGVVTLVAALSVRLPRERETGAPRGRRRAPRLGASRPARLHAPRRAADPRHWYLNALLAAPGRARPHDPSTSCRSRATRASAWPGRPSRSPPTDSAPRGGRLARRRDLRSGGAARHASTSPTASPRSPSWAFAGCPRAIALLAALVAFGAGFAATDTMVVKVVPDLFGVRAHRRHHGHPHAGLALAGRRWVRRRPASSTTSPAPTHLPFGVAPARRPRERGASSRSPRPAHGRRSRRAARALVAAGAVHQVEERGAGAGSGAGSPRRAPRTCRRSWAGSPDTCGETMTLSRP